MTCLWRSGLSALRRFSALGNVRSSCIILHTNSKRFSSLPQDDFYSSIDYNTITKGDETLLKKLKVLLLEVEVLRQEGEKVPSKLTDFQWSDLLTMASKHQRLKQLAFWWGNERKRENDQRKKLEKQKLREEEDQTRHEEKINNPHIYYGFGGSTIFLRIYDRVMDNLHNNKLIQAMMFSQNLVLDCSYDSHMNVKEAQNCAKQLMILFAENRLHREPFNIHFCNAQRDGNVFRRLEKFIPTMYEDGFPMNITEKSYLDVFPKERLVYLTPHCREELLTYNHDDVYIIGALVDKVNNEPVSLAKAKSEGLRMAKLPLDRYLAWCMGSKSLTLNQVLKILLDMRVSNDWNKALLHVPRRKITENEQHLQKEKPWKKHRKLKLDLRSL